MAWLNKTPFKLSLNLKGNDHIAHRKAVTTPLTTIFEGDNDKVYPFTRAFAARIESIGIEMTFGVKTTLDPRSPEANESAAKRKEMDEEHADDPGNWHYEQFLRNESVNNLVERAVDDRDWMNERLSKLIVVPTSDEDDGSRDYLEQQHRMWITELIYASVNDDVHERLANHEEMHQNDGAVMWAIFMTEYGSAPQDAIAEAEIMLRVEKLHLSEHSNYITQLTAYMRTQVRHILNSGNPVAPHHFINLFKQLIVVKQPEFAFIIVTLYNEWRTRSGEGHTLGIMRLLNKIDADARRINKNGTDLVSGEDSTVLAMKDQIADLKKQMIANLAKTNTLEEQNFAFAAARHGGDNHRN
jgi:hypothetical protein